MRIVRLDDELADFLRELEWPAGVPAPGVDAVHVDGKTMLRFVAVALAPDDTPADCSSPGASPFEFVAALGALCEAWCRRHGAEPGVYPKGIRAQVAGRLELRTAARWLYSVQLAGALAASAAPR